MNTNIEWETRQNNYFFLRSHDAGSFKNIPQYLLNILPKDKSIRIIDIGCGFGEYLRKLKLLGYENTFGIDISNESIDYCLKHNLYVELINDISSYVPDTKYDLFILNHVLEHIDKSKIISTLNHIRTNILTDNGYGIIIVPNAQSNTGPYWAYEDFTHSTLFTSGSLKYVSLAAGFRDVYFTDKDSLLGSRIMLRFIKQFFLVIYKFKKSFWNKVTSSSFHKQSEDIFGFELKLIVKK